MVDVTTTSSSVPLYSVNAIRVIAEYFVIRLHTVRNYTGMDMFVRELMSFFFVLSGFVMMYTHMDTSFSSREAVIKFLLHRWWKVYPTYLLCWLYWITFLAAIALDLQKECVLRLYCSFMQLLMLDCWSGCGIMHVVNGPSWYLSCICWIWLVFPAIKDILASFFCNRIWVKIAATGFLSTGILYLFQDYDIFSTCTLPILRIGEFIVGCGAACSLRKQTCSTESPTTRQYHWYYLVISMGGLVIMYSFLGMAHGIDSLCLHQNVQSPSCTLWQKSQWVQASPPCYTMGDKYFNKNAVVWALAIHTVAQAELDGHTGWFSRFLQHGIFKWVNRFSLTLYLGHSNVSITVKWLAQKILGWDENQWGADTVMVSVYCLCFLLHNAIHWLTNRVKTRSTDHVINPTNIDQSSFVPLIHPNACETETDESNVIDVMLVLTNIHALDTTHPDDYQ